MSRFKKDSLTKKILVEFGKRCQNLLVISAKIVVDPNNLVKEMGLGLYQDYSQTDFSKSINYLKRSKYFDEKEDQLHLTREGRIEIIKTLIKEEFPKRRWDGKYRVIIFDIPELSRKDRVFLRKELRWMGFVKVQRSVWVFPYDIEKELKCLLKLWRRDFEGDIRFGKVEELEPDQDLKQHFGLK